DRNNLLTAPVRGRLLPLISAVFILLAAGCQHGDPNFKKVSSLPPSTTWESTTLTNQVDPAMLQPPLEPFTLGPGDKLEIELLGETGSRITTVVGPDGKVYFNLLPGIDVWGLTLGQAKARMEKELSQYLREQPQVSLVLRDVESKRIWVLGYVQAPGVYPLAGPMTLLEAISLSGGTMSLSSFRQTEASGASDELADLQRSFVLRQGKFLPVNFQRLLQQGDLSQNIYLQPDDFIYFPAAAGREVYVLGAVTEPRAVPYKQGMTVATAVASAYGTLTGAYLHHVLVVRGSLSHPEVAVVDYKNVIRGEARDVELLPRDIVYVPFSAMRYPYRYLQLAIDTFVSSAAINAGTSLLGQPQGGGATGVFIPVGSGIQVIPPINPPPIR
ncbi:MAG TPA: SLBB domain-containing protein, partial [Clostridia bacterium]|nr:SLBB domain-containing protein [Clostridia bacterium]